MLTNVMFENNSEIPKVNLPDLLASYFDKKFKDTLENENINNTVYNGTKKATPEKGFFMDSIKECLHSLKPKNSEGFGRIPQRIILNKMNILQNPLTELFSWVYSQKKYP
jgi:hypothetical protein